MKLRMGLVGVGYWQHYTRILSHHKDIELVWVCDLKQENLDRISEEYPYVKTTTHIGQVVYDKTIEAVIICTPVTTHFDIAKSMLLAGKHILCEKAFTVTEQEAQQLIDISKLNQLKICVGHTFIYNSLVDYVKNVLDTGGLGDLYFFSIVRTGMSPVRQDVNAMVDLGAHDVSMLLYWLGEEPIEINTFGNSYLKDGTEDVCFTNMKFSGNIIANIHCSWLNPIKERKVTIVGSEKMLVMDDIAKSVVIYDGDGGTYIPKIEYGEPLKNQVADFVDSIKFKTSPKVTGEDGKQVVSVLNKCQETLNERHRIKNTVLG